MRRERTLRWHGKGDNLLSGNEVVVKESKLGEF
jgi:hypothetical protein